MEEIELIEKLVIVPEVATEQRQLFLSNIDLSLNVYQESVSFYDPPMNISFSQACDALFRAMASLLVPYDFFAGRLIPSTEDESRFKINCNGAGVVIAAAKKQVPLSHFSDLLVPKPQFKTLVTFLHEENEEEIDIKERPLLYLQFTQFGCGSLALASRYNHCVLDGVSVRDFQTSLASLTRGGQIAILPNPDRSIFRARTPPSISHHHHEYCKAAEPTSMFTSCGTSRFNLPSSDRRSRAQLIHVSQKQIDRWKSEAGRGGMVNKCSRFHAVSAKIWRARSIALRMDDEDISMMLFPVDARKIIVPPAPVAFAGNALVPGFAQSRVRELKEEAYYPTLVSKVQEGIRRLGDGYIRSGIDWLEVHRGAPSMENCFSLVSWSKLGLEEDVFLWGKVKCATPIESKPGLVFILPAQDGEGGLNICLELAEDQMEVFSRLLME